jgi:aminopeptidase N
MKKLLVLLAFVLPFLGFTQSVDDAIDIEANAKATMYALRMQRQAEMGRGTAASENFDVKYYRCEWEVDPAVRYIAGKVTTYFKLFSTGNTITVDLSSALTVDSVKRGNVPYLFTHSNNALQINFAGNTAANVLDSVSIWYKGVPPTSGFGSFAKGTATNGTDIIWTLSEPYGSRDWWPCSNGLGDKADSLDVYITHPANRKAVGTGMLQWVNPQPAGKAISYWKHRYPIVPYLVSLAVADYAVLNYNIALGTTNLPMITYCYNDAASINNFQANTPLIDGPMQYLHAISPYPFINEKYGHVQFGWNGGMEHQTNSFMVNMNEALIVHELAHQWVGNKITCASWEDIWLNEGFASYFTNHYLEIKYPQNYISNRNALLNNITSQIGGSVKVVDTSVHTNIFNGRLIYRKGGYLLFTLKFILGDAMFTNVLKKYLSEPNLVYASARTSDFKRVLERETGKDFSTFFKQWYEGEGYPSFNVKWYVLDTTFVRFNLSQITSHPSVSFYKTPIELTFKNATQSKTVRVNHDVNNQIFTTSLGFKADTVLIDSSLHLISKNNTAQKQPDVNDGSSIPLPTNNGQGGIDVNPNPLGVLSNIYLHDFDANEAQIAVHNAAGQLLFSKQASLWYGTANVPLSSSNWAKGMYIITVKAGNTKLFKKIVK